MAKSAWIVVGSQWGDEGKGLISAYLGAREKAVYVARAGTGANAEHGIFLSDENTYLKCNQLPLGWMFNPATEIRIGSGVAVDPLKLLAEIEKYGLYYRTKIDYRCPIITREHIEEEESNANMNHIGSTMSGTGRCRADFVLRKAKQARDFNILNNYITDTAVDLNSACSRNETVIIESSQGTFLSLAVSPDYPNVTSDNVTTAAAVDDVLLNWQSIKEVVLVVKALPTREGAGKMGSSGELTPEEIAKKGLAEPSSVRGEIRRKASGIDFDMLRYAVEINGATQIALTFCDHYDPAMRDVKSPIGITRKMRGLINKIEKETFIPVTILNTGKCYNCIVDMKNEEIQWDEIQRNLSSFGY